MSNNSKISSEEFAKALKEKGANVNCSACGQNNWSIPNEIFIVPIGAANTIPLPGIPAGMLICKNCGLIRLHSLPTLNLLKTGDPGGE